MTTLLQPQSHAALPHVLVVDDDPTIRELVSDYLGKNELRVTAVADGRSMQEILADQIVDLVVLDLKLRGEDGMSLARRLRDESEIPIVMLTGRGEEADRIMGLELGADAYLTKPFSPRELLARIRTVLRRRRAEVRQGKPEGIRAYRFDGWELNLNLRRPTPPHGRRVAPPTRRGRGSPHQRRIRPAGGHARRAEPHHVARPVARPLAPAQRRGLQPL